MEVRQAARVTRYLWIRHCGHAVKLTEDVLPPNPSPGVISLPTVEFDGEQVGFQWSCYVQWSPEPEGRIARMSEEQVFRATITARFMADGLIDASKKLAAAFSPSLLLLGGSGILIEPEGPASSPEPVVVPPERA